MKFGDATMTKMILHYQMLVHLSTNRLCSNCTEVLSFTLLCTPQRKIQRKLALTSLSCATNAGSFLTAEAQGMKRFDAVPGMRTRDLVCGP